MTDLRLAALTPQLEAIANGSASPSGVPLTDLGNAERLVARHGVDLRHARGIGWLAWDGKRWRRDEDGEVMRRAKRTARSIYAEAEYADGADERKAIARWAAASESERRLCAAVALATTESEVVVAPADLDADPFLLNVENGTLDLRTGELGDHRREDLLTKLAPVAYRPEAESDVWVHFIARVTGADAELAAFLQRAVGYTLTGDTSEEVLFFAHGPSATGKTTFLEALKTTLGEYAATADFETFLARRGDAGARSDIARLDGVRLVSGVEVDEGKRLAEGLIKQLTGGDTITARFLYRDYFEFRPQLKLWLAANHRPRASADDDAIWRRIVQIPFTEVVPTHEREPDLKRRLTRDADARSAILMWALRGSIAWRREGLNVPERVLNYTADYRAENDPLAEWLDACCQLDPQGIATATELRADYEAWADQNGEERISAKKLAAALRARGLQAERARGRRAWRGISLRARDV